MKAPRTNTTKGAAAKLLGNPTSTGTTIYECCILIYLALEHILHNDPRHVEYREARKQAESGGSGKEARPPTPHSPPPSNGPKSRYSDTYPPFINPNSTYWSPERLRGSAYHGYPTQPAVPRSRFDTAYYTEPSKGQKSEAWGRMREVRRFETSPQVPVVVYDNTYRGLVPKVHWGSVQVNEYEQVCYESPPGSVSGVGSVQVCGGEPVRYPFPPWRVDGGMESGREVRQHRGCVPGKNMAKSGPSNVKHEVWGAVPRAGNELEVWGAVPNAGEIWGAVGPDM